MRTVTTLVVFPWIATSVFWLAFTACIDSPMPDEPALARVIVAWDPLACGEPHRVAVELEDQDGIKLSSSTPCTAGSLTLEARHFGVYYGRVYAWEAGKDIRSVTPVRIFVDEPVTRWLIVTPP